MTLKEKLDKLQETLEELEFSQAELLAFAERIIELSKKDDEISVC